MTDITRDELFAKMDSQSSKLDARLAEMRADMAVTRRKPKLRVGKVRGMAAVSDARLPDQGPRGFIELSETDVAPAPVEAVVFDLGGVLIAWDPLRAITKAVGAEQATRFLAAFSAPWGV